MPVIQETIARFRDKIREEIEHPGSAREALWALLGDGANQARDAGEPAEQFLVRVKQIWDVTATEYGGASDSIVQRLKQDVVTHAIKAYYMQ